MKKIISFAFMLCALFGMVAKGGDFAWYSVEINDILGSPGFSSEYRTMSSPVTLYGVFDGAYWVPPYATVNYITGEVTPKNDSVITVSSFAELNNYGKYSPSESLANYQKNCREYLTDNWGQPYIFYSDLIAKYYSEYEKKNISSVEIAFDQLRAKFQLWIKSKQEQTGGLEYDASALAEDIKTIDLAVKAASEKIKNTVKSVQDQAKVFNTSIAEAQQHLANVANDAVYDANQLVSKAVTDFTSFVSKLESALESGEGWKDGAEEAFGEIDQAEKDILAALQKLEPFSNEPEVNSARQTLFVQQQFISSLKSGLRSAIDNNDLAAARSILNSAKSSSFVNSKKAMQRIANAEKTYKSQANTLAQLQKAAHLSIENLLSLAAQLNEMREEFDRFVVDSMDNFHNIGAYLGSTNSMEYLNWRKANGEISKIDKDNLARWSRVSFQSPLFRDAADEDNYQTISRLGKISGATYDNVFRLLGSTYFVTYMDLEWMDRFAQTYDEGGFYKNNIRGFYQEIEASGDNTVTNWIAGHITAPKNWADGTTVIVTNGVFTARGGSSSALRITTDGQFGSSGDVTIGSGATTNTIRFSSGPAAAMRFIVNESDNGEVSVSVGALYQ